MISKTDVNNILAEKERRECSVDLGAGRISKVDIDRGNVGNVKQERWEREPRGV